MTPVNFTKTKNIDRSSNINIIIYLINIFGKFQLPYMAETNYEEKYLP